MTVLSRSGPLQRAASRLAHALSLVWLTNSAPAPFAATGVPAALTPDDEPVLTPADSWKEISDEPHS